MEGTVVMPTTVRSYETSDKPGQSDADFTDIPVNAQTVDGQQIVIKYTVIFRIPPENAVSILQNVGPLGEVVENVVKAHSRNLTRLLAQGYTAEGLYSGDGIFDYQETVRTQLGAEVGRYGVLLDDLLIRKIEFDGDYIAAIEQQQIAQEQIETAQYQAQAAEHQRDQQITLGEGDKERAILMAQAEAEQVRLAADAEAYSIETRGEALRDNPELIQWEFVKNLSGVQWGIMPDSSVTPLLPVPGEW
jgi:regulator of protease activity HflC (stomatin/prohibitin superfamily)